MLRLVRAFSIDSVADQFFATSHIEQLPITEWTRFRTLQSQTNLWDGPHTNHKITEVIFYKSCYMSEISRSMRVFIDVVICFYVADMNRDCTANLH